MKLALSRVAQFLVASESAGIRAEAAATGYSIDSRTIQPGELFFAVKGEKMDGHERRAWSDANQGYPSTVDLLRWLIALYHPGLHRHLAQHQQASGVECSRFIAVTYGDLWLRFSDDSRRAAYYRL